MNRTADSAPSSGVPLMMVRPASFGFDEQTAATNTFQVRDMHDRAERVAEVARAEVDALADALRRAHVPVLLFDDPPLPVKPNAVFPNNWVSFHEEGTVILYPMATESRRVEVQPGWIERLGGELGFRVERVLDWRGEVESGRFLEGTGSLVLDRPGRVAYAALSPRTDLSLARRFAETMGYELVAFRATDPDGVAIYHTNVLLSVGPTVALACFDCIPDQGERKRLRERLEDGRRLLAEISWEQLCGFGGNALEVRRGSEAPLLAMSARAREGLAGPVLAGIEDRIQVVSSPIPTIERLGGGSVRCMLAAIHLPRRPAPDES